MQPPLSLSSLLLVAYASNAGAAQASLGFFPASAEAQARAEQVLLATPSPDTAQRWLRALTEEPHVAGTPQEKRVADWVKARFEEFGLETEVSRYEVFLNHPRSVALKLTEPVEQDLSLVEPAVAGDKDSGPHGMFPGFHGYGASGKAEGQVVYVNYGTAAEFRKLDELGVSVEGRIVLARYGQVFRGLKVKEAQERGARGVLIYSDPADDGYMKGDVYPAGPMRPATSLQRGSVQFLSLGPGDPSTPGWPSTAGAKRIPREQMTGVPKIPSLPISYGEAEKILRQLGGSRVPDDWQGGLPFAYHVGPGVAAVSMDVQMDEGLKPIYDVFARIRGTVEPEKLVILGNHRDAWTHGAADPNSGTTALLEVARSLSAALKAGWKPRRTILLASWDAEEYGLVGSTEWAEDQAKLLGAEAVAYLNVDVAVTGSRLRIGGAPSLRDLLRETAAAVPEPRKGGSLLDAWEAREREDWARDSPVSLDGPQPSFELALAALGSGSDYTAFLDHLGVPAADVGFGGSYGVYHSVFDNFRWMATQGDPGFLYHAACARLLGLTAMRLASAEVVPLRFASYGRALREQLDDLRRDTLKRARRTADASKGEKPPLQPDFGPVLQALEALSRAGSAADQAADRVARGGDAEAAQRLSAALVQVERAFLSDEGLPRRPWFRHLLTAPGTTTGYAAWPFPGLTQAVEDRDPALFDAEAKKVVAALSDATRRLEAVGHDGGGH
jgi:N-acetylated-alpha-linked acidic dipeptidase